MKGGTMTDQTGGASPDLPYVDGRDASPDELRAEVAKESDPQVQRVEEARDQLLVLADELGRRLEPRYWLARLPASVWVGLAAVGAPSRCASFVDGGSRTVLRRRRGGSA